MDSSDEQDLARADEAASVEEMDDVEALEDGEIVDALPVMAGPEASYVIEEARPSGVPAVQVAALAATGFVAGAATVAVVSRRRGKAAVKKRKGKKKVLSPFGEVVASNSFLVDVHLLRRD